MKIYSYDNHIFNDDIIDKLIYTSINNITVKDNFYILINLVTYNKLNIYDKKMASIYDLSINEFNYNDLTIPKLYIHKIIINKVDNNISLISNCIFNYNNIYVFLNNILNNCINDIEIINNILIIISKKYQSKYNLYVIISTLSKLSSHIIYIDSFLDNINYAINFLKNKKNIEINDKIKLIKEKIISIKFFYDTIKTTSIQKISYHETNISKILTYVATIFLPLSFVVGVFSLIIRQNKKIPFINNKNSIYFILFILFTISIITSFYLIELNKINVFIK